MKSSIKTRKDMRLKQIYDFHEMTISNLIILLHVLLYKTFVFAIKTFLDVILDLCLIFVFFSYKYTYIRTYMYMYMHWVDLNSNALASFCLGDNWFFLFYYYKILIIIIYWLFSFLYIVFCTFTNLKHIAKPINSIVNNAKLFLLIIFFSIGNLWMKSNGSILQDPAIIRTAHMQLIFITKNN